ncbi:dopamine receptor 2-like [Exaiptasia diaphana]|uniref:G-protein coupled receptors family 1 profile domain-containing protein n=1 Tax=Exaiptasia diaphana TaxID=2652724 RepID=A0A913Y6P3_EXADI|nr:dopamine receptor 2-like [Exaiptasia diaphana]XP_020915594.1 dopamine receptor 2-like [Exaiptasia diaphana]XP_020915662.1 dopamine receptor 2-like [Exaiptasia diaphana]XP_020915734.1 dopamine receptor 2-like [Exaiptasia diaphana]XP_028519470.1 dopamine receptor 2-like [Exaiptasia diaphana]XP_028519502.1 dopamine receptor 2-like [Exaiptasia diaphana]XP_028519522.1 dopamine receptor 2-like [Exaiptasia diaphana]XP_028519587.1 dopamine receptor 2-like [Exaiptasia diaphana]XP_028519603.1 dopa
MNSSQNVTIQTPFSFTLNATNVISASLVALQIIINLVGNIMVVVCFHRYSHLRTRCNYFIISLSLADICVALFAMPFWLVLQLTDNMERDVFFIISKKVYLFWSSMDILVGVASTTNLAAVSFDRQLAITSPFHYQTLLSHRNVIALIVATWIYSILITSGRIIDNQEFLRVYYIPLAVTFGCFLPLAAMIVMYGRIYWVARSQAVKLGNYSKDIKAAKTIAIVIGSFLVCWLPFFLFSLSVYLLLCCFHGGYRPEIIPGARAVKWMAYLNSCLNPIIYTCLNRPYRSAFYKMFKRCFHRERFRSYNHGHNTSQELHRNHHCADDTITFAITRKKGKGSISNDDSSTLKKQENQVVLLNGEDGHGV